MGNSLKNVSSSPCFIQTIQRVQQDSDLTTQPRGQTHPGGRALPAAVPLTRVPPSAYCRHTLWKRVQGAVTPLLASMVAVIDRDSNLELLAKPDAPAWVRELWMFIFSDINLLNIPLVTNYAR